MTTKLEPRPETAAAPQQVKLEPNPATKPPPQQSSPPPPPRVPRSPKRAMPARVAQAALPPPEPPSSTRELPADPAAREAALAEVRPSATMILAIADVLAARLPPQRALSTEEKKAIQAPLELVLYKYDLTASPEWQLTAAIGMVAFGRWVEVKAKAAGVDLTAVQAAAQQTVEVKR